MTSPSDDIHPDFQGLIPRNVKESRLNQRGHVFWFYGLSGSGKSTLAYALEKRLWADGYFVQILDGDNIRTGLNENLGFSDEDRLENIRRISEVSKLFVKSGVVTLVSFITPKRELRAMSREIIGTDDFSEVYVEASFETCAERDVKGLYAKAKAGNVKHFTGKDSSFEAPEKPEFLINTEKGDVNTCLDEIYPDIVAKILK